MKQDRSDPQSGFRSTVWNDFKKGGFKQPLSQDFKDLYDFYVDQETRRKYEKKNVILRRILISIQIFKNMVLKLTPARRLLLFIALILLMSGGDVGSGNPDFNIQIPGLGITLILVVLMLELKDKLLAKDELEAGRRIQMALMPEMSPDVDGWDIFLYTQPAREVGGDLVDFIQFDECRAGVVLGDVAGKGLSAALVMSKVQASLRALAPLRKGVGRLVEHINDILIRDCLPSRFTSLIYIELNIPSGEMQMVNAGHLPPVIRGFGDTVRTMEKGTLALGLKPNVGFRAQTRVLEKGEMLILFSDGITEAQNRFGEFFGEKALRDFIQKQQPETSRDLGEAVLTAISEFQGNARAHDDLSLVILKRK